MTEMPDFNEAIQAPEKISESVLEAIGTMTSTMVHDAIQTASSSTERSEQQQNFRIGVSTLGHCRQYAKLMIEETPFSDVVDKSAAFFGTVTSEPIERQIKATHPEFIIQEELVFNIPSGGSILGHSDIIIPYGHPEFPQMLIDLKSKAELETIRKNGRSQQQQFQLDGYTAAAIDKGYLNPDEPILQANVFYDRSGRDPMPYSIVTEYDPAGLGVIDQWIEDVKYAVIHKEDASRDLPREFCARFCEYFTACRGNDTDAEGLIEDPEILAAVDVYAEGSEMEREGKKKKDRAKEILKDVSGSTGEYVIRSVEVGEVEMKAYTRKSYVKIDIRKVKKK